MTKVYRVSDDEWEEIMGDEQIREFAVNQVCDCPDDFLEDNIKGYYENEQGILDLADRILNKGYTNLTLEEVNMIFNVRCFEYKELNIH